MKIWEKTYKAWKEFSPFFRRKLMTKKAIVSSFIDLGLVRSIHRREFTVLITFLEEIHRLCPLFTTKQDFNDVGGITFSTDDIEPKEIAYYHPLQLFEAIHWFSHSTIKKPPYHLSREFRDYFQIRKLQIHIRDLKDEIINLKRLGLSTTFVEEALSERRTELENIPNKEEYELEGTDLWKKLIYSSVSNMVNENVLIAWIKIESLLLYRNADLYGRYVPNMEPLISNNLSEHEVTRFNEDYKKWREDFYENPHDFLDEKEISQLKEYHNYLYSELYKGDFPIQGNWWDLFDIISTGKLDKLKGFSSYFVNLSTVKRYIERIFWKLFRENLDSPYRPQKKPGFCFDESDIEFKELIDYKKSILIKFNLLVDNPFILYVDGEAEKTIIDEYQTSRNWVLFNVKNMRGMDKFLYFAKITENVKEHDSYFFFDYDNLDKYKKNKEKCPDNSAFFFPDFITENFTPEQIFETLKAWLDELELEFTEDIEMQIKEELKRSKDESEELLKQVNSDEELSVNRPKGYETKISSYFRKNFSREFAAKFPERLQVNQYGEISDKKKFNQIMKTEISERIKFIVSDSIINDPQRNFKFPFEVKLEPFFDKITDIINRTPNIF